MVVCIVKILVSGLKIMNVDHIDILLIILSAFIFNYVIGRMVNIITHFYFGFN